MCGADGKIIDYTRLVDGYGSHLYPTATTTLKMVQDATNSLRFEAAHYPHVSQRPIWITEWNPARSSWWNNQPWYFQYDEHGQPGGDLNKSDARGVYKAMDRAGAIRAFNHDVVQTLRKMWSIRMPAVTPKSCGAGCQANRPIPFRWPPAMNAKRVRR